MFSNAIKIFLMLKNQSFFFSTTSAGDIVSNVKVSFSIAMPIFEMKMSPAILLLRDQNSVEPDGSSVSIISDAASTVFS